MSDGDFEFGSTVGRRGGEQVCRGAAESTRQLADCRQARLTVTVLELGQIRSGSSDYGPKAFEGHLRSTPEIAKSLPEHERVEGVRDHNSKLYTFFYK